MVMPVAGQRQPPVSAGWGILDRRNGEISGSSALLVQSAGVEHNSITMFYTSPANEGSSPAFASRTA
jgi:hypothetical protein